MMIWPVFQYFISNTVIDKKRKRGRRRGPWWVERSPGLDQAGRLCGPGRVEWTPMPCRARGRGQRQTISRRIPWKSEATSNWRSGVRWWRVIPQQSAEPWTDGKTPAYPPAKVLEKPTSFCLAHLKNLTRYVRLWWCKRWSNIWCGGYNSVNYHILFWHSWIGLQDLARTPQESYEIWKLISDLGLKTLRKSKTTHNMSYFPSSSHTDLIICLNELLVCPQQSLHISGESYPYFFFLSFFMNGNTERAQCALSRVCIP